MIVSREHRYIFLHCRKTAGSSIAVSLARDLGPDDLLLSAIAETLDAGIALPETLSRSARLGQAELPLKKAVAHRIALSGVRGRVLRHRTLKNLVKRYCRRMDEPSPEHAFAETVARMFPQEWAAFQKFCVVRNPWTRLVSDYFWQFQDSGKAPTFMEFVRTIERGEPQGNLVIPRYYDNWPLYTINDRIVADHVIRFEDLTAGVTKTCAALGIPFDGWLPRAKGSHRPKSGARADPFSFYTPELRDTVGRLYEKEVDAFGYSFDPTPA